MEHWCFFIIIIRQILRGEGALSPSFSGVLVGIFPVTWAGDCFRSARRRRPNIVVWGMVAHWRVFCNGDYLYLASGDMWKRQHRDSRAHMTTYGGSRVYKSMWRGVRTPNSPTSAPHCGFTEPLTLGVAGERSKPEQPNYLIL